MRFTLDRAKRPYEEFDIGVDFAPDIGTAGDTPGSYTVTASLAGTDVTSSFIVSPTIAGTVVKAIVNGGVHGSVYLVNFKMQTTNGMKFEHDVVVRLDKNG